MPFVEIMPLKSSKQAGTGARVSLNDRGGLVISLSGEALAALGGGRVVAVNALLDADPAYPRLRLITSDRGAFKAGKAPLGDRVRIVRIGHRPEFGETRFKGLDCIWERLEDGRLGIDIDLPRELRCVTTSVKTTTTGLGDMRTSPVSLPGGRGKACV